VAAWWRLCYSPVSFHSGTPVNQGNTEVVHRGCGNPDPEWITLRIGRSGRYPWSPALVISDGHADGRIDP